jgi:MoaA/NifB/PqqE/SkfB family radical SAM enzyme
LSQYKISAVQIDVNGLCNAGCWFCPVSYEGNPKSAIRDMELGELENILSQLHNGKGDFVDPNLKNIYTANYNEVLLYKNFEEMFDLYRKYNFTINILTNGTPLTKKKTDIIKKNIDVVGGMLLNIPSGDKARWSKYVNLNEKMFDKMVDNVLYAAEELKELVLDNRFYLMVNGLNDNSLVENGGWLDILPGAPDLNLDVEGGDLAQEVALLKSIFPSIQVFPAHHLYDRAGHLADSGIIDQTSAINKYLAGEGKKVIGCNGGLGVRSRTNEWVHINPNGDLFICCADFDFKTVYGNSNNSTIKDVWFSKDRADMIEDSYSNMCIKCSAAIWG